MAKSKKDTGKKSTETASVKKKWQFSRRHKVLAGILFFLFSIALLLSFVSYFLYGDFDQSGLSILGDRSEKVYNWLGKFGAYLADFFIYRGFGVASFIFIRFFFLLGAYLVLDLPVAKLKKNTFLGLISGYNIIHFIWLL